MPRSAAARADLQASCGTTAPRSARSVLSRERPTNVPARLPTGLRVQDRSPVAPVSRSASVRLPAALLVLFGVALRVFDHALDIGLAEAVRGLDADLLLLAGGLVPCRDVEDAVGVDVERDFDLRHAAWCLRNSDEIELAEQLVVAGH